MGYRQAFGLSPISYTGLSGDTVYRYSIVNGIAYVFQILPTEDRLIGKVTVPSFGHAAVVRSFMMGE